MKIGILTLHRPCNFGANLQAYATYRYLQSLGNDVKVIDYIRTSYKRYNETVPSDQYDAHKHFVESRLDLTRQAFDAKDLSEIVIEEHFDAIMIGSDAVWKCHDDNSVFFAKWLFEDERIKDIPVYSLSSVHMGNGFKDLSKDVRNDIRECLSKFKCISVRDEWTRYVICRDIFGDSYIPMATNPDPVFMLPQFIDNEVWDNRGLEEKKFILMTLPNKWMNSYKTRLFRLLWFSCFKRLAHKKGLQLVELPLPEGRSGMRFDFCIDYPIDPMQWFLMIKHARAFIGLRFHSIVSCIACGTPFYSIDTYGDKSTKRRWLDIFGFHKKARTLDYKSKIRNLLNDSSFESYRTRNIEWESPNRVLSMVLDTSVEAIVNFRDNFQKMFRINIANILNSVERHPRAILSLSESCTGCFACANACAAEVISMTEDQEGFYHPVIDSSRCINCGMCDNVCPELTERTYVTTRHAYYGWSKDDDLRMSSSSGGMFAMLSNIVLKNGGVVFGAAWNLNDDIRLETKSSDEVSMKTLQKSKYVQSYVGDAFRRVKTELVSGRQVLFCGTPCQISGLRSFLRKDYDNLLCVDFICHGVPSMSLLRKDLLLHRLDNIEDIDFRPKNRSWIDDLKIVHSNGKIWELPYKLDEYFSLFKINRILRRSCYSCKYCNGKRSADITLGDFWGIKKNKPELWDKRGISIVFANTDIGEKFMKMLRNQTNAEIFELPVQYTEYAYSKDRHNPSSGYDIEKRNAFIKDVYMFNYEEALSKYGYKISFMIKCKYYLKSFKTQVKTKLCALLFQ